MNKKLLAVTLLGMMTCLTKVQADVDPNFHIYLCFGQSNMEGNAQWESVDNAVDARFQMLATTNFDSPKRTMGNWYTAKCPIVSPVGKLGMADYFGRTMVAAMPAGVKIGVVDVAIGGCDIRMFDKQKYTTYAQKDDWSGQLARQFYGGNPYQRLISMAKKAQQAGVIKGILLHQGCTNNGDPNWPSMVKKIYQDILTDLGLAADSVPLFAGETEQQDMGGGCYAHNTQVNRLPQVIPTAHVVHSNGVPGNGQDPWHFSAAGYRTFGKRYAIEVLKVMGLEAKKDEGYTLSTNLSKFFTPKSFDQSVLAKPGSTVVLKLWCNFQDGHREDLTNEAVFSSTDFTISNGRVKVGQEGTKGIVTAVYHDFLGNVHTIDITIESSGSDQLGQRFTSIEQASGHAFAIVNEDDGKVIYGSSDQNLGYDVADKAFADSNTGYMFQLESLANNADSSIRSYYLLRLIQPNGQPYSIWGSPGYLNSQPANQWCSFILGLNNQNGQDMKNGAVWEVNYVDGLGFTLRNIGTGLYLHDAAPAKYDTPAYFSFCTLSAPAAIAPVQCFHLSAAGDIYTLQGVKVGNRDQWSVLPKGLYIMDGKVIHKQ